MLTNELAVSFFRGDMEQDVMTAIDMTVPHSARVWNYWLGGKDHYPVDREAGAAFAEVFPGIVQMARASRHFLARVVRYLAGEVGIRQFLDIGAGLPGVDNTHDVAQRVDPACRVVYVDHDPLVLAFAGALLASRPEGVCACLDADVREPDKLLRAAADTLDCGQPVALLLMGVMGHVRDEQAYPIVWELVDGLAPGSFLALHDGSDVSEAFARAQQSYNQSGATPYYLRSPEQIARFFEGLVLVQPGVLPVSRWRPEPGPFPISNSEAYGGVGRKPGTWRQPAYPR